MIKRSMKFSDFDEQYHQWYDRFEKEDGLKEGAKK